MNIGIVHYSAPPVVGGVEQVMQAHAKLLLETGYGVTMVAGTGAAQALPQGTEFICIPEMDTRAAQIEQISAELMEKRLPENFGEVSASLERQLEPALAGLDRVILHNIFTKHFNLPLTAALSRLLDQGKISRPIAWCHDFSWTSPHSRRFVHEGYPWDLLRTYRPDMTYVTVSKARQAELAELFGCPKEKLNVIYNGVDPEAIYGLTEEGRGLFDRLELSQADLVLLMPLRITQAKNIEFALEVLAELKDRGFHPRLVVTGPPDPHDPEDMKYFQHLLDLRRELGVEYEARFVYECGPDGAGYTVGLELVSELYRACDALFMPSRREGFGMPVLEAGLFGRPIFSTSFPASVEIGDMEVYQFGHRSSAADVASLVTGWAVSSNIYRLRKRVRQSFTWHAIFQHHIQPLLK